MNRIASSFFRSQEEQDALVRIENLKRLGRNFIHIRYIGNSQNPRFHGLEAVEAYQMTDPETGKLVWHTRDGSRALEFTLDTSGEHIADVLDTEHNRFWLSRHLGDYIEIDDKDMRKQVFGLRDLPYKVELSRKDELLKRRRQIEEELSRMDIEAEGIVDAASPTENVTPEIEQITKDVEKGFEEKQTLPPAPQSTQRSYAGKKRGRKPKRLAASNQLNQETTPVSTGST